MVSLIKKSRFFRLSGLSTLKILEILLGMREFGIWIFIRKAHQLKEVTFVAKK